ncbi:carbohydrate ABC transporter permease [Pedococcus sp. P5_B7]
MRPDVEIEHVATGNAPRSAIGTARKSRRGKRTSGRIQPIVEIGLAIACLLIIVPIAWMVVLALQPGRNIVDPDWAFSLSMSNFEELLGPGQAFAAQAFNSLLIVLGTVALCALVGSLTGYALSLLNLPRSITWLLLGIAAFLQFVPPMALVPGLYVTMDGLGLLGTIPGLIVLNTVFQLPFSVLLMKVYFDAAPRALREAAMIDGASEWRTFLSVMLPLVRPGVGAVAIFAGIMAWNEFLFGLTMTSGGKTSPLTVGIASLVQEYQVAWGQMAAAGAAAAIPMVVLGVIANRQIVAGLTGGAVKG